MKKTLIIALSGLAALTACSSPADVEKKHAEDMARYADDLARANEWNVHTLGIPASGWVVILITAAFLFTVLLICAGTYRYHTMVDRRQKQHQLNIEREKTRRSTIERGVCGICGADPSITGAVKNAVETSKT